MTILVTGCLGQCGRAVRQASSSYGHTYIYKDGPDVGDALDDGAVDVIINCSGDDCVLPLAEAAARTGALLIHISEVRTLECGQKPEGGRGYVPVETEGERIVVDSGCRHVIIRTSWVYGDGEDGFIWTMAERMADSPVVEAYCDRVCSPTYAVDLAEAVFAVLESGRTDVQGIYEYADEGVCSLYDFVKEICDATGYLCEVRPCVSGGRTPEDRTPDVCIPDRRSIKGTFGLEIPHWKDSLVYCIRRMDAQEHICRRLVHTI